MKRSSTLWRLIHAGVLCLFFVGCASVSSEDHDVSASSESEQPADDDPDRPSPVLPEQALFLGPYASLELSITAHRDGSLEQVAISKKSEARLYDEYTRAWVERHWKMPPAKEGEPDLRGFIAPIVYPIHKVPAGGHFPAPSYPSAYLQRHMEGLVVVEITVAPSGEIESTRTVMSSGHKGLDDYSENWVRKKWKFPKGDDRTYYWPVAYLMPR